MPQEEDRVRQNTLVLKGYGGVTHVARVLPLRNLVVDNVYADDESQPKFWILQQFLSHIAPFSRPLHTRIAFRSCPVHSCAFHH